MYGFCSFPSFRMHWFCGDVQFQMFILNRNIQINRLLQICFSMCILKMLHFNVHASQKLMNFYGQEITTDSNYQVHASFTYGTKAHLYNYQNMEQ